MVMPSVLSELLEDTANDPDVVQPPPSASAKMPEPVLDYRHVKRAFVQTLFPEREWTDDPKSTVDGFAQFDQLGPCDRTSAKRLSDGSSDRQEKRRRHASKAAASENETQQTSQLCSIGKQTVPQ